MLNILYITLYVWNIYTFYFIIWVKFKGTYFCDKWIQKSWDGTALSKSSIRIACFGNPSIISYSEYRFIKKNFNPPMKLSPKFNSFRTLKRKFHSTESKAFSKSRNNLNIHRLLIAEQNKNKSCYLVICIC